MAVGGTPVNRGATGDTQVHLALFRVFDGIAEQVVEDLGDPFDIALDEAGQVVGEVEVPAEAHLLCPVLEAVKNLLGQGAQRKGGLHALRFSTGQFLQIEDVIDQAEQVPAGEIHVGEVSELFVPADLFVLQELVEPQDGVQWGPDFVAHHRQESGFGVVGDLCRSLQIQDVGDVASVQVESPLGQMDHVKFELQRLRFNRSARGG